MVQFPVGSDCFSVPTHSILALQCGESTDCPPVFSQFLHMPTADTGATPGPSAHLHPIGLHGQAAPPEKILSSRSTWPGPATYPLRARQAPRPVLGELLGPPSPLPSTHTHRHPGLPWEGSWGTKSLLVSTAYIT